MINFSIARAVKQLATFSHRKVTQDYTSETIAPGYLCDTPAGYLHFSHVEYVDYELYAVCYRPAIPELDMPELTFTFHASELYHINFEAVNS